METPIHILMVEDSADDSDLIIRELRREGMDPVVRRVDTPEAMAAALDEQAWDAVISDYFMPRFSAPAALSLLREKGLDIPFIIVSGSLGEEMAVAAMKAGAQDYLLKDRLARLAPVLERERREARERRERRRSEEALAERNQVFRAVVEGTPDAIYLKDSEGRYRMVNSAGARCLGKTPEEVEGKTDLELFDRGVAEGLRENDLKVLASGRTQTFEETIRVQVEMRTFLSTKCVYRNKDGRILGLVGISHDITDRIRAERERAELLARETAALGDTEISRRRMAFLAEASILLSDPLDLPETLTKVARRAVPFLADLCLMDLLDEDGAVHRVASVGLDPVRESRALEISRRCPPKASGPSSLMRVLRTGTPEIFPMTAEFERRSQEREMDPFDMEQVMGMTSAMILPLSARGHVLGALTLGMTGGNRRFTASDLVLGEDLGVRCAMAVDNARLLNRIQQELAERKRTEGFLHARASQQVTVAELGQRAMSGSDLGVLMDEAVVLVGQTLGVEFCNLLELLPDGQSFLLRSGVGWKEGSVGHVRVPASRNNQSGYTLFSNEPVIVKDFGRETRFQAPALLSDHGVIGGISVVIPGKDQPFGILGVHSAQTRDFSLDDVHFIRSIANVLATAIGFRRAEETIRHLAFYDPLTDLPNRRLLQDRLKQALRTAQREEKPVGLLIFDLDRFKEVNDSLGHPAGDMVLKQVGPRLRGVLRESDTVARLGGDEFAVVLPGSGMEGATQASQKILEVMERPFLAAGVPLQVGVSIGVALYPEHGTDDESLMRYADGAMYAAKQTGNRYCVSIPDSDSQNALPMTLMGELRECIERNQLMFYYQPIVNIRTRHLRGMEALVHWHSPRQGVVPPGNFIPLAERTGLIKPLTEWALRSVLKQIRHWNESGTHRWPVTLNLSGRNLYDPLFPELVETLLEETGVDPRRLEFDVKEAALAADGKALVEALARLHRMGLRLHLEEFGAGFTSMALLQKMHVTGIKIPSALIREMSVRGDIRRLVRSIIEFGHNLGYQAVAVGVEDRETWNRLKAMGCDGAQGYLIGRPMPPGELTSWLAGLPFRSESPSLS